MPDEDRAAVHGGDLAAVAREFGVVQRRLLDFSANLNPLGPPRSLVRAYVGAAADLDAIVRYPSDDHAGLTAALARHLRIDPASIVVANGAAALLDAAVRVRPIARCLVPQPAFAQDRRALAAAGVAVAAFPLSRHDGFRLRAEALGDAMRRENCDAVLVTNPHNPSGALASRATMRAVIGNAHALGALAIVDEAFIDYAADESVASEAASEPQTIVIRSLTKFFGAPGVRAGYAVCEPELASQLRATLPPWPVSSAAARAFVAALRERSYARRSIARNERERRVLARSLRKLGFGVVDGAANFLLLELPDGTSSAGELREALIRRDGIVVRDCTSYETLQDGRFVRVAVRSRRDGIRLVRALRRALTTYV